jgi:hypothetical protein
VDAVINFQVALNVNKLITSLDPVSLSRSTVLQEVEELDREVGGWMERQTDRQLWISLLKFLFIISLSLASASFA